MRVFIAGATGVVGRSMVPMLLAAGHEVVGLARSAERAAAVEKLGAEAAVADALDRDAVIRAIEAIRPEAVVHQLTAIPQNLNPRTFDKAFEQTNRLRTEGTRNLIEGAAHAGVTKFVAQSVAFAYDPAGSHVKDEDSPLWEDPPAVFAKVVGALRDMERRVLDADGTVLRYGHFYGPGTAYGPGGVTETMVRKRRFPIVGDGGGVFSFVSVDDAARTALLALEHDARGLINVVDDDPAPVRDWLPAYAQAIGAKPPRRVPEWLARPLAGEFGVMWLTELRGADNSRAKSELGWRPEPASWREGLRRGAGHHT